MKYNDNVNSIDLKLYIDLIHYIIERLIFEFSHNYYFENKSFFELKPLFELKSLIFNRIN